MAAAVVVSTWPFNASILRPSFGPDAGWQAALAMDAAARLPFGTRVAYNYGPLGFLSYPRMYVPAVAAAGVIYLIVAQWALVALLLWRLRSGFPLLVAVALVYLISLGSLVLAPDVFAPGAVLVVGTWLLTRSPPASPLVWAALGALVALMGLSKVSVGFSTAVVVVLLVAATARRRIALAAASVLGGAAIVGCAGWFGTGNGIANIGAYVHSAVDESAGYADAFSIEAPQRGGHYVLALGVVLAVAVCAYLYLSGVPSVRARALLGVATAVVVWSAFQEGFIRHDTHDVLFFAAATVLLVAFLPPAGRRRWVLGACLLAAVSVTWVVEARVPVVAAQPWRGAGNLASELRGVLSTTERTELEVSGRRAILGAYPVPRSMLRAVRGQSLDVAYWDESVAWAVGARYDPLPVPQDSNVYTPYLDALNTAFVDSALAPRYLLRFYPQTLDGEERAMYPPEETLAIDCRYRQVDVSTYWELLARGSDRCGRPQYLSSVTTGLGHVVVVPEAKLDDFVVMRVQLSLPLWWHVEDVLFKPPQVNLMGEDHSRFRYIAAISDDPSIVRVAADLGYSRTWSFSYFPLSRVSFSVDGMGPTSTGVHIEFQSVPLR